MLKNIFLLLFVIFLGISRTDCKGNKTKDENHLYQVSTSLSTLSRLITGLSIQWTFMRSSDQFHSILSDRLSISNATVFPEILSLDIKKLSNVTGEVITVISGTEVDNSLDISKIKETIETFEKVDLEHLERAIDLPNLKNFTNSSVFHQQKITDYSITQRYYIDDLKESIDILKNILQTSTIGSYYGTEKELQALSDLSGYRRVVDAFEVIKEIRDNKFIEILLSLNDNSDKTFKSLEFLCEIAALYDQHKLSKATFQPFLSKIDKTNSLITRNQLINESIRSDLQNLANHLLSLEATDKESIDGIFKDLETNKWLRSVIDYKKSGLANQLISSLSPLQNFLELLKPVETRWKEIRDDKEVIRNVERIAKILELQTTDMLKEQMNQSIMCMEGLKVISDNDMKVINQFQNVRKGFGKVKEELKKFQDLITVITSDNDNCQHIISQTFPYSNENPKEGNSSVTENWYKEVKRQFELAQKKISISQLSLIRRVVEKIESINATLLSATNFNDANVNKIPGILNSTALISGLTCFQNISTDNKTDKSLISKFKTFFDTLSAFKNQTDAALNVKTFFNRTGTLISRTDKLWKESVIKMLDEGPEERKILMMKIADKVALFLSAGTRVIRNIAEVWQHRERIQGIVNMTLDADKLIRSVYANWTDKNIGLINQLISDVISLNEEAGEMRSSRDPMDVFEIFELALNISGAPINSSSFSGVIFEKINNSNDSEISKFAPLFKDFPALKLDFSNDKTDLEEALQSRELINEFLDDFSGIGDKDSPPLIANDFYLGISIVGLVLLVSMFACAFVLYSGKKDRKENKK